MAASDPKPGGDKQALMDSFKAAKSENTPPNEADPSAPADPNAPPDPNAADAPPPGADVQQIGLKLDHLLNLLMSKGILQPHDIMSPPQVAPIGAPGAGPAGPPPGAPQGPPPGM